VSEFDTNFDGYTDAVTVDPAGDGYAEAVAFDTDQNGVFESLSADSSGDGVIDTFGYDSNQDGVVDAAAFDTDQDGASDRVVLDTNQDGVDDQYGPSPDFAAVGGEPARDGAMGLVIELAAHTGDAVWAETDIDGDHVTDGLDPYPFDPGQ
jgi:hypothetical protein